jgi:hypothetical protein
MKRTLGVVGVIGVIALFLIGLAIAAWFTQYFVNYLFTSTLLLSVFGTAKLSLTQGFVLNALFSTLFKTANTSLSKSKD